MKFEVLPPAEDVEVRGPDPKRELPDQEDLERQLQEAARAAGADDVEKALAEVAAGEANPEALLAWMDDLRDPEERSGDVDPSELQEGMVPDFIADSEFAGGSLDINDPNEHTDAMFFAGGSANDSSDIDSDADADYFLSILKKRRGDPEDPEDSGDDKGGDGGGGNKTKEKAEKRKVAKKAAR